MVLLVLLVQGLLQLQWRTAANTVAAFARKAAVATAERTIVELAWARRNQSAARVDVQRR